MIFPEEQQSLKKQITVIANSNTNNNYNDNNLAWPGGTPAYLRHANFSQDVPFLSPWTVL